MQRDFNCSTAAADGLCLFPLSVFHPFLNGARASERAFPDTPPLRVPTA